MSHANGPAPAGVTPAIWRAWLPRIYRAYAIGVGLCIVGAFSESFANLIVYFLHQGLPLALAVVAPSMVDIFTIGGEVLVLISTVNRWETRYKVAGWVATGAGLSVSIAGNVGKDGWRVPAERAGSYAIAPLALAGLLALGLMIVKRELHPPVSACTFEAGEIPGDVLVALAQWPDHARSGTLPSVREVRARLSCGQPRAERIRGYLTELAQAFDGPGESEVDQERVA